ncbi:MAG: hypothetical protein ACKN9T_07840 [Candidatus Methylumidiphilus sp.]
MGEIRIHACHLPFHAAFGFAVVAAGVVVDEDVQIAGAALQQGLNAEGGGGQADTSRGDVVEGVGEVGVVARFGLELGAKAFVVAIKFGASALDIFQAFKGFFVGSQAEIMAGRML